MRFSPTKSQIKKPVAQPSPYDLGQGVDSVIKLVGDLTFVKQDIINTVDTKIEQIDIEFKNIKQEFEEIKNIEKGDKGEDADEQKIADWVLAHIEVPKDGKDADPEEVINEVLSRLPPVPNKDQIVKEVLKQLPTPTASLKIIKEELNLDKEALLEEILKSPKFKLKIDNIDGLKKTLDVLDRRYMHGGGDTVTAGTGITITNLPSGNKQINATGSGTGTVTSFTFTDGNGFDGTVTNGTTTPALSLTTTVANGALIKSNSGALTAAVGNTDYQVPISLTTTGTSGAATFNGTTLNIPQYSGSGGGYSVLTVTAATVNVVATSGEVIYLCDCTSNNITLNLPSAVGNTAKLIFKKIDSSANTPTIDANASQTIDNNLTEQILFQYTTFTIISDNANWWRIN